MKRTNRSAVTMTAAAGAVAMLLSSVPLFAAPQQGRDYRDQNGSYRSVRDERVEIRGRVRSFNRERDGYRVFFEGDNRPFWVPASRLGRDLRVGINVSLGGIFRGGVVNVDAVTWPDDRGAYDRGAYDRGGNYDRGRHDELRGVIERIDYRSSTIWLRNGRQVTRVDMNGRNNLRSVHRGDRVTLEGRWSRDGDFEAYRVY